MPIHPSSSLFRPLKSNRCFRFSGLVGLAEPDAENPSSFIPRRDHSDITWHFHAILCVGTGKCSTYRMVGVEVCQIVRLVIYEWPLACSFVGRTTIKQKCCELVQKDHAPEEPSSCSRSTPGMKLRPVVRHEFSYDRSLFLIQCSAIKAGWAQICCTSPPRFSLKF